MTNQLPVATQNTKNQLDFQCHNNKKVPSMNSSFLEENDLRRKYESTKKLKIYTLLNASFAILIFQLNLFKGLRKYHLFPYFNMHINQNTMFDFALLSTQSPFVIVKNSKTQEFKALQLIQKNLRFYRRVCPLSG